MRVCAVLGGAAVNESLTLSSISFSLSKPRPISVPERPRRVREDASRPGSRLGQGAAVRTTAYSPRDRGCDRCRRLGSFLACTRTLVGCDDERNSLREKPIARLTAELDSPRQGRE